MAKKKLSPQARGALTRKRNAKLKLKAALPEAKEPMAPKDEAPMSRADKIRASAERAKVAIRTACEESIKDLEAKVEQDVAEESQHEKVTAFAREMGFESHLFIGIHPGKGEHTFFNGKDTELVIAANRFIIRALQE